MSISISPAKAKELSISNQDIVAVIGRRRTAALATVHISKKKKSDDANSCQLPLNLAKNLRIRDLDTIKLVPLGQANEEEEEDLRSGDLKLLNTSGRPSTAISVTLSPVDDSLIRLQMTELDGDEMEDDALMERFIAP